MPALDTAEYCTSWTRNESHLTKFTRQFGVPREVPRELALGDSIYRSLGDGHCPGFGQANGDRSDAGHYQCNLGNLACRACDLEYLDGSFGA